MSDIREWLFEPLIRLGRDVHRETGTRPRIQITVHPDVFAQAVEAADIRYGITSGPPGKPTDTVHLGDYIEIVADKP